MGRAGAAWGHFDSVRCAAFRSRAFRGREARGRPKRRAWRGRQGSLSNPVRCRKRPRSPIMCSERLSAATKRRFVFAGDGSSVLVSAQCPVPCEFKLSQVVGPAMARTSASSAITDLFRSGSMREVLGLRRQGGRCCSRSNRSSVASISHGRVMMATGRIRPPQLGQVSTSTAKTFCSNVAQPVRCSAGTRDAPRRSASAVRGTILSRRFAAGAKIP